MSGWRLGATSPTEWSVSQGYGSPQNNKHKHKRMRWSASPLNNRFYLPFTEEVSSTHIIRCWTPCGSKRSSVALSRLVFSRLVPVPQYCAGQWLQTYRSGLWTSTRLCNTSKHRLGIGGGGDQEKHMFIQSDHIHNCGILEGFIEWVYIYFLNVFSKEHQNLPVFRISLFRSIAYK